MMSAYRKPEMKSEPEISSLNVLSSDVFADHCHPEIWFAHFGQIANSVQYIGPTVISL